jgi:WD40 repeat protein/beta-lactamase regulating signal transducer with metallopeptidase domain
MELLLGIGLSNAVLAGMLALLVVCVSGLARRPALAHCLWLLVLVKLLTPPLVSVSLPWLPPEAEPAAPGTALPPPPPLTPTGVAAGKGDVGVTAAKAPAGARLAPALPPANTGGSQADLPAAAPANPPATTAPWSWDFRPVLPWVAVVWLLGSVTWLAWVCLNLWRFQRLLRHARRAPEALQTQAQHIARELGLRRCPAVWLLPGPLPPLVWALTGPVRVFFPSGLLDRLDAEGRATLLAHELAHVRRGDHWVRWLELVVLAVYWWYPLAWWARRQVQLHEEECCDAWVVSALPPRVYAAAILETVDFLAEPSPRLPALASGLRRLQALKRRLLRIMEAATPRRLTLGTGLAALAVAGLVPFAPTLTHAARQPVEARGSADPSGHGTSDHAGRRQAPDRPPDHVPPLLPEEREVLTMTMSPDGKTVTLAIDGKVILVLDVATGELRLPGEDPGADRAGAGTDAVEGPLTFDWRSPRVIPTASEVRAAALAPDGRTFAVALADKTVLLLDVATGATRLTLHPHDDPVTCLAFSPEGKTLATGSQDRTVRLWDLSGAGEGREIAAPRTTLRGHTNWVYALAFAPDGRTLASGGYDRTIRLWDPTTGKERGVLKGHKAAVRSLVFGRFGRRLASGDGDGIIKIWDLPRRTETLSLGGHQGAVRALAFAPDGRVLASAAEDNSIRLWHPFTGKSLATLERHSNEVWALAFSPRGRALFSGSLDSTFKVWDVATGRLRTSWQGHSDGVTAVAITPDGSQLLTAGLDRTVKLWPAAILPSRTLAGHQGPVRGVAFSPDGKRALSCGGWPEGDRTVRLWDVAAGREVRSFRGRDSQVLCVTWLPAGRHALFGGEDGLLHLWDTETGDVVRTFAGHTDAVAGLAVAPDGKRALSAGHDGSVRLWDIATGKELRRLTGHGDRVRCVAFTPDGKHGLSGGGDGTLRLWDLGSGRELRRLDGPKGEGVECLAVSPDGKRVLSGGGDLLRLWDLDGGREIRILAGHQAGVTSVAFGPDGGHALSGSRDGTVRWWDLDSGREVQRFVDHREAVASAALSPDGRQMLSGGGGVAEGERLLPGGDFALRLWTMPPAGR